MNTVYSLLWLMPSPYQKASLQALLDRILSEQGHALPKHTPLKLASSLSRFLDHYDWLTRQMTRATRAAILQQLAVHPVHPNRPVRLLVGLTTL